VRNAAKLETTIERAIKQRFRLQAGVIVLDRAAYARIVRAIPRSWVGDTSRRANIAFVRRGTDAKQVVGELRPDAAVEEVKAIKGAILWATKRDAVNRSVMRKLIGGAAYKELTIRNLNTTSSCRSFSQGRRTDERVDNERSLPVSKATQELIGETARVREREEVATRKLVDLDLEALLCNATLELDRKEAIVASGDHVDRDRGPCLEIAALAEHDVGFGALLPHALFDDLRRNVVEEVRGEIEGRAVSAIACRRYPRFLPSGVRPPLTRPLAGHGDHGVDEHHHPYPSPRAHERCGEAAERLRDENHPA
jgi:uncharacterized protein (DUF1697 family)